MLGQLSSLDALALFAYFLGGLCMLLAYNADLWTPKLSDNRKIRILTRCLMIVGWPLFLVAVAVECIVGVLRAIWHEIIF